MKIFQISNQFSNRDLVSLFVHNLYAIDIIKVHIVENQILENLKNKICHYEITILKLELFESGITVSSELSLFVRNVQKTHWWASSLFFSSAKTRQP